MRALAFALLIAGLVVNIQVTFAQSVKLPNVANLRGLNYGPFRNGESPALGIFPTAAELQEDVIILSGATNLIQLFSSDHGFGAVVPYAAPLGLEVIPGCFLNNSSNDDEEVNALIDTLNTNRNATNIPFVLVGSEAVSEQGVTASELIARINQVRSATGNRVLIATAEFPETWIQNPELASTVDVILVNIYPYYNGLAIDQAIGYLIQQFDLVKSTYPSKPIMIGETGWPSAGETMGAAVASVQNEETYFTQVLSQTYSEGIGVLLFEAFDEAWKSSPGQQNQGNFGMFTSQRNVVNGTPTGTPKGAVDNTFIGPGLAAAILRRAARSKLVPPRQFSPRLSTLAPANADACEIAPQTSLPASFVYQTTDPKTNALTGTANAPANIAQGGSQSFVIAFTPTAAFVPTNVAIDFFARMPHLRAFFPASTHSNCRPPRPPCPILWRWPQAATPVMSTFRAPPALGSSRSRRSILARRRQSPPLPIPARQRCR